MLQKGGSTAFVWMDTVNEETLISYKQLLEDTLKTNELQNYPSQIYNVDKTGVPLNLNPKDCGAQWYMRASLPITRPERSDYSCGLW